MSILVESDRDSEDGGEGVEDANDHNDRTNGTIDEEHASKAEVGLHLCDDIGEA